METLVVAYPTLVGGGGQAVVATGGNASQHDGWSRDQNRLTWRDMMIFAIERGGCELYTCGADEHTEREITPASGKVEVTHLTAVGRPANSSARGLSHLCTLIHLSQIHVL